MTGCSRLRDGPGPQDILASLLDRSPCTLVPMWKRSFIENRRNTRGRMLQGREEAVLDSSTVRCEDHVSELGRTWEVLGSLFAVDERIARRVTKEIYCSNASLIAPRAVYVASADEDLWCDPRGEFLSLAHASPVYALWNEPVIRPEDMPPMDQPLLVGRRAYHVRSSDHDLRVHDWHRFMDFADVLWRE